MAFCGPCRTRTASCLRRCERIANGKHLWMVMRDEMMRGRPKMAYEPMFDALPEDVRRAYVVGAAAIREMGR